MTTTPSRTDFDGAAWLARVLGTWFVPLDRRGVIRAFPAGLAAKLGVDPATIRGQPFEALLAPEDRRLWARFLDAVPAGDGPTPELWLRLLGRDGELVRSSIACGLAQEEDGTGWIALAIREGRDPGPGTTAFRARPDGAWIDLAVGGDGAALPLGGEEGGLLDLLGDEDRRALEEALATGADRFDREATCRGTEGDPRPIELRCAVIRGGDGAPLQIQGTLKALAPSSALARELEVSRAHYRALVENLMDGVVLTRAGRIEFANQRLAEMFGYASPDEMVGESLASHYSREAPAFLPGTQRASTEPANEYETPVRRKDDRLIWVRIAARPVRTGGVVSAYGTVRDITAEKRLLEDLELFRRACEASNDGMALFGPEGDLLYQNEAFMRLTEPALEDGEAVGYADLWQEGTRIRSEVLPEALRGEGWRGTLTTRCTARDPRICAVSISPVRDRAGRIVAIFGIHRDVTEERRLAQELRSQKEFTDRVLDSMGDWVQVSDASDRVIFANRSMRAVFGDLVGRRRWEGAAIEAGRAVPGEAELELADRTYAVKSTPIPESDQGPLTVDVVRDTTELKRLAVAAQAASRAKSHFLATVGHELRTPLNGILGYGQLLAAGEHGPEEAAWCGAILDCARKLLRLIDRILDVAHLESGEIEIAPRATPLRPFLEALASPHAEEARRKGVAFAVEIDPETPEEILVDPDRLAQILDELLANAVAFTERGRVGLAAVRAAPDRLRFAVRDTGCGIAAAQLEEIFQPFVQGESFWRRSRGGVGLGLAIARKFAEFLGGELAAASREGEGSEFHMEIPLAGDTEG